MQSSVKDVALNRVIYAVAHPEAGMIPTLPIIIVLCILVPVIIELLVRFVVKERVERHPGLARAFRLFHKYFPFLVVITCMLIWSVIESAILDGVFLGTFSTDYTPLLYNLEGNAVERIQEALWNPVSTYYFAFMYMVMYVVTFYLSIFLHIFLDEERVVRMLVTGYVTVYLVALPFYVLFPVNEVWVTSARYHEFNVAEGLPIYDYNSVRGVLYELGPTNNQASYIMNSLDNCFPSLHTAISVLVTLVMFDNRRRSWGLITAWIAGSIIVGIFYLGTHWVIDMLAGLVVALFALYVARNLEYRMGYPLSPYDIRWRGKRVRWLSRGR
jgi:membrane-associated phospholipid phosphatase